MSDYTEAELAMLSDEERAALEDTTEEERAALNAVVNDGDEDDEPKAGDAEAGDDDAGEDRGRGPPTRRGGEVRFPWRDLVRGEVWEIFAVVAWRRSFS